MNKPLRTIPCALAFTLVAALSGCPSATPDDGFGPSKPVKNDGMVRKPGEQKAAPPDFANAVTIASSYDKAAGKVLVTLQLKPGFHAYAPGEEVGKPVELVIDGANGWSAAGAVVMPTGIKKDLGDMGTSMILEGDVPLSVGVKGGTGNVEGDVKAQVCTDAACDRPRSHHFSAPTI